MSGVVVVLMAGFLDRVFIGPNTRFLVAIALIGFTVSACSGVIGIVAAGRWSGVTRIGTWSGFLVGILGLAVFTVLKLFGIN